MKEFPEDEEGTKSEAKHASTLLFIVDILKKNSDKDHPLSVRKIKEIMDDFPYEHNISERNIERKLELLRDYYMDEFRVKTAGKIDRSRTNKKDGKTCKSDIYTGYYYDATFSDAEYHLLMDSILFSRFITPDQVTDIYEKLAPLADKKFSDHAPVVRKTTSKFFAPKEDYIRHMEILSEAISKKLVVNMVYGEYSFNKKLTNPEDNEPKEFNAHSLILKDGEYYVLGHWSGESVGKHNAYKLSRIKFVEIAEGSINPNEYSSYNAAEYVASHPKMQEGRPRNITLRVKEDRADLIIENFGNDFKVRYKDPDKYPEYDGYVEVQLIANPEDVYRIALENADSMEVISPKELRHKISDIGASLQHCYNRTNDDRYLNAITPTTVTNRQFKPTGDEQKDKVRKRIYDNISPYSEKNLNLAGIDLNGKYEFKEMTDKEYLTIGDNNLTDYSFLANFKNIKKLVWHGLLPNDMSWLKELENLRLFYIENSKNNYKAEITIPDFTVFNSCKNLEYIVINASHVILSKPDSILDINLPALKGIEPRRKGIYEQLGEDLINRFKEKYPDVEFVFYSGSHMTHICKGSKREPKP